MSRLIILPFAVLSTFMLNCCGPKLPVGDAKGGYIDWFATTKSQVQSAAENHCAAFGKKGRVTNTEADKSGGHAFFVCE